MTEANPPADKADPRRRVLVVGSGWRFTSGISYYTCRLATELDRDAHVSVILMRRLVPRILYPGRRRVGRSVNNVVEYPVAMPVLDGVDWFWGLSMRRALKFLREQKPDVVIFEWWTGAVLHSYLRLAAQARAIGAKVVVECHEVQDTGEARVPLVSRYVRSGLLRFVGRSDGLLLHSEFDRKALDSFLGGLDGRRVEIAPHGPYDHVQLPAAGTPAGGTPAGGTPVALAPSATAEDPAGWTGRGADAPVRLLFFGTIRPYKGLEDLVAAFGAMPSAEAAQYRLSIVGETWEGWDHPLRALDGLARRDLVEVVNQYVTDAEVAAAFAAADVVVLPYRRSSSSGPLHIAMAVGLPVVVSKVGGLIEAVDGYEGAVLTTPGDPAALLDGIRRARSLVGRTYPDPRSWADTRRAFGRLMADATAPEVAAPGGAPATTTLVPAQARPALPSRLDDHPTVTVVVACFDEGRFEMTMRAIRSVLDQDYPHELVVVVDHNEPLADRLRSLGSPGVTVLTNVFARGASGARNTAALKATTDLVAFLDDDACAEPEWLAKLVDAVRGDGVVGAGGLIRAEWSGSAPSWFPAEFGWVVGASIPVQHDTSAHVRNVWAGSMVVRAEPFRAVGGFRESWGKVGTVSEPEDTDLCLRLTGAGAGRWLFVPASVVFHAVVPQRATLSYFVRRCWSEGRGKARLREVVGDLPEVLASESDFLRRIVPRALVHDSRALLRGDVTGLTRGAVALVGSAVTTCGFVVESMGRPRSRAR